MGVNNLLQNKLMGRTATILSRALDFRTANHKIISGNLANMKTSGYKTKELHFEEELRKAVEKTRVHLKATDPRHISYSSLPNINDIEIKETGELNLDMEMAKMMSNNLLYEASARLLSKKFQALRAVIEAGRR